MGSFVWFLTLAITIYIRSHGYEGRELRHLIRLKKEEEKNAMKGNTPSGSQPR